MAYGGQIIGMEPRNFGMRMPTKDEIKDPNGMYRVIERFHQEIEGLKNNNNSTTPSESQPQTNSFLTAEIVEELRVKLGLDTNLTGAPRNNYKADRNPEPSVDNLNEGYIPGSEWCNIKATPLPSLWKCVESSSETAAWRQIDRA